MKAVLSATIVAAALASLASPAVARIVPQRSIASVELGMTRTEVRATLGTPTRVHRGSNEFGHFTVFRYFRLKVTFQGDASVTAVKTTRRRERTRSGVGVGSTRAQVDARVANTRCGRRECVIGRFLPGRRVTVFRLFNGRVTSVLVGLVID